MKPARSPLPGLALALGCLLAALLSFTRAPAASSRVAPPGARPGDGGPSRVIFPEQTLPLRFDHKRHVLKLGLPCAACHDAARTSRQSADGLLPDPARCDGCHGSDHSNLGRVGGDPDEPGARCEVCHAGYRAGDGNRVARVIAPRPNLHFDHALHVGQRIACARCHGAVEELGLATREQLPRMRGCLDCHTGGGAPGDTAPSGACSTCHLTEGARLKTEFASGSLLPPAWLKDSQHDADWIERHRRVAGDDSRYCSNCHSEKYCADCHDGRVRPRRVHPNDYLSLHAVAARMSQNSCTSCHKVQSFCVSCHQRSGIAESGPYENFAGRGRIHPPRAVWTEGPRAPGHHAWEAQRNLNACISCHVERDCTRCHSTRAVGGPGGGLPAGSGQGVNPHPVGFRSRCGRALRQNARPCLVCHDPSDPELRSCR